MLMQTIVLSNPDGSTVNFVDPAGVQAAVDAAIAALPVQPTVTVTDTGVTIAHSDGTTQDFVPVS